MNGWDKEEFEKAISNYERLLQERPGDQELLERYQLISLEYARYRNQTKQNRRRLYHARTYKRAY